MSIGNFKKNKKEKTNRKSKKEKPSDEDCFLYARTPSGFESLQMISTKKEKPSDEDFSFSTESQGFEPWVPFGNTAFRVLHLRPLGQLSVCPAILTKNILFVNYNFLRAAVRRP